MACGNKHTPCPWIGLRLLARQGFSSYWPLDERVFSGLSEFFVEVVPVYFWNFDGTRCDTQFTFDHEGRQA